jgi:transposase
MKNEKEVLLSLYKSSKESMRAHAVLLVKEGKTIREVAKLFYVDEDTIRNWVTKWDEENEVKDAPRTGASPKLTKEIEKEIIQLVDENNPENYGMFCSSWDCSELRIYIKQQRCVAVCNEQIRKLLKRNNFNWRKINYKFIKADEEKRKDFLEDFKQFHDDISQTTLIFQDEMASKLHPNKGYIWTREEKPFIETECSHEKTYIVGGVSPTSGETFTLTNEKFNSLIFVQYLKLLLDSVDGEITIVLDNSPVHHSKIVNQFVDKNQRLNRIFLPEYSPDLNPKENFWNYLRKKFLNNKVFKTVGEMSLEVLEFIKKIPREVVKKICSYDYLLR